jgi:hypothetical protein
MKLPNSEYLINELVELGQYQRACDSCRENADFCHEQERKFLNLEADILMKRISEEKS